MDDEFGFEDDYAATELSASSANLDSRTSSYVPQPSASPPPAASTATDGALAPIASARSSPHPAVLSTRSSFAVDEFALTEIGADELFADAPVVAAAPAPVDVRSAVIAAESSPRLVTSSKSSSPGGSERSSVFTEAQQETAQAAQSQKNTARSAHSSLPPSTYSTARGSARDAVATESVPAQAAADDVDEAEKEAAASKKNSARSARSSLPGSLPVSRQSTARGSGRGIHAQHVPQLVTGDETASVARAHHPAAQSARSSLPASTRSTARGRGTTTAAPVPTEAVLNNAEYGEEEEEHTASPHQPVDAAQLEEAMRGFPGDDDDVVQPEKAETALQPQGSHHVAETDEYSDEEYADDAHAEDDHSADAQAVISAGDPASDGIPAHDTAEEMSPAEEPIPSVAASPPRTQRSARQPVKAEAERAVPSIPTTQRSAREAAAPVTARTTDRSARSSRKIPQPPPALRAQLTQRSQRSARQEHEERADDTVASPKSARQPPRPVPRPAAITVHPSAHQPPPAAVATLKAPHHRSSSSLMREDIPDEAHMEEPHIPPVDEEDQPSPSSASHSRYPSVAVGHQPPHRAPPKPVERVHHPEIDEEPHPSDPTQPVDDDLTSHARRPTRRRSTKPRIHPPSAAVRSPKSHAHPRASVAESAHTAVSEAEDGLTDHVYALEEEIRELQSRVRSLSMSQKPGRGSMVGMAPFAIDYSNRISELERELVAEKKERKVAEQQVRRLEKECMREQREHDQLPSLLQKMTDEMTRERAAARKARERVLQAEQEVRRLTTRCLELEKRLSAQERLLREHREKMRAMDGGGTRHEKEEEGRMEVAVQQHRREWLSLQSEITRQQDVVRRYRPPLSTKAATTPTPLALPPWNAGKPAKPKPVVSRPTPLRRRTAPVPSKGKKAVRPAKGRPAPQSKPLPPIEQLRAEVRMQAAVVAKAAATFSPRRAVRLSAVLATGAAAPLLPAKADKHPSHIPVPNVRNASSHQPHALPVSATPSRLPVLKAVEVDHHFIEPAKAKVEVVKHAARPIAAVAAVKPVEEESKEAAVVADAVVVKISARRQETEEEVAEAVEEYGDDYDADFD